MLKQRLRDDILEGQHGHVTVFGRDLLDTGVWSTRNITVNIANTAVADIHICKDKGADILMRGSLMLVANIQQLG